MPTSILISTIIFVVLTATCMIVAYRRADGSLAAGLQSTWAMFRQSWLLLVVAWVFSGYVEILLPSEFVAHWLGPGSGWRGIALACLAGGITPGGPYTAMPIAAGLHRAGAGAGVLVAYLSAWSLYALGRLPFEITFMGVRLALIWRLSACLFPPVAGIIARLLFER